MFYSVYDVFCLPCARLEEEASVEEERKRTAAKKEREERNRQDAMTLGETKEQIQKLNVRLEELRNEKQQLFLHLKKVLNRDENRKKQQQQQQKDRLVHHQLQSFGSRLRSPVCID